MKWLDDLMLGKDFEKNLKEQLDYGDKIWEQLSSAARILGYDNFIQYADSPDIVTATIINEIAKRVRALEENK